MLEFLRRLFGGTDQQAPEVPALPATTGDYITQITGGANLVDGRQTWELAEAKKHDLVHMQRCCEAELKSMARGGGVAAPYYFERVAILLRKNKDYRGEIAICETYIDAAERYYVNKDLSRYADVRKSPRYLAIVRRLSKARALCAKQQ